MTTTTKISELENMLSMFNGGDKIYRHGRINCSSGIMYLAENAECYWLLDIVASYQSGRMLKQPFQVWKLDVGLIKGKAVVICDDGNDNLLIKQKIPFTDFPLKGIKMYYENNLLCLPSER